MTYYSKTLPNLVNPEIDKYLEKIINADVDKLTFSDNVTNYLIFFYNSYIYKYLFVIILIIFMIICLIHRYYTNLENNKKYNNKNSKEMLMLKNIYSILSDEEPSDYDTYEYLTFT